MKGSLVVENEQAEFNENKPQIKRTIDFSPEKKKNMIETISSKDNENSEK